MSLLDDLNNVDALREKPSMKCGFCRILNNVSDAESEQLKALMKDETITKKRLAAVLTSNGHPISSATLYRHANGSCYGSAR